MMLLLLNTAEAFALLIPIGALMFRDITFAYLKSIKFYLFAALILNTFAILIDLYLYQNSTSIWLQNNNYVYNIHSVVRYICFTVFFHGIFKASPRFFRFLPFIAALALILNFCINEKFFHQRTISSSLFAAEAGLLLLYCLQYFIVKFKEDSIVNKDTVYWVVLSLSIYVVFNFPFFLLYGSLKPDDQLTWWYVHNVSYVAFCTLLTKAFLSNAPK